MRACPGDSVLESMALRDEATGAVRRHAAHCAACLDRIEHIRQNDRFLSRVAADLAEAIEDRPPPRRPPRPCPPRDTIPGYQLVEEISRGGQGVVYRAIQTHTRRAVAIKMLLAGAFASERQLYRFERETELAAGLRHPNIVTIFQSGVAADGGRYVAMEFVHGVPLDRYVEETLGQARGGGRVRADAVMRLMLSVAQGVGHAHSAGVIHRDIKPSNILVDQQGVPRVLDFGLARAIDPATPAPPYPSRDALMTESFAGTPAYAAPERLNKHHVLADARGDVYSLGMVLYRLLTDHAPYPSEGPMAAVARHAAETVPTPPSRYAPRVPMDVQTIVLRCLAKDAQRRYASASALAEDIEAYLGGNPIAARRDSAMYVLRKLVERNRMASTAMAIVALTVLLAAVGFALLAADLDRSRRDAEAALSDSTVQRARMMALAGDPLRAETLLWGEALRAGVATDDAALWHGTPEQLRSVWSLAEFYERLPRLMRVRTEGQCASAGLDMERREVWAIQGNGSRWSWSLDGRLIDRTPALTPWAETAMASTSGRYVVVQGEGRAQVWDLVDRAALAPPFASVQPAYYSRIDDLGRVLVYGNTPEIGALRVSDARGGAVLAQIDAGVSGYVVRRGDAGEIVVLAGMLATPVPGVLVARSPDWAFEPIPGIGAMLDSRVIGGIRNLEPSRDGRLLAVSTDNHLYLFGLWPEPTLLAHVGVPTKGIDHLAFDDRDESVIVAGRDGLVARYAMAGLEQRAFLRASHVPFSLSTAGTPPLAILALLGGGVTVFAQSERPWCTAIASTPFTHASIGVSHGGVMAWGDDNGGLHVLSNGVPPESQPLTIQAHDGVVTSVAFSPDGARLVTTGFDGMVREWNVDGSPRRLIASGVSHVSCARYAPDGQSIAYGEASGIVHVWRDGQPSLELPTGVHRVPMVEFSPDGGLLLCAGVNSGASIATVFDLATGVPRYKLGGHGPAIRAVAWSPDGTIMATAGDDRTVRIWDAADGRELRAITGLPWGPYDLAFHPEGTVLFAVGPGGSIIVADPVAGVELAKLPVHDRHVFSIALGPDGTTLYTSGEDSWIGVTDLGHLLGYIRGNENYWRADGAGPWGE